MGGGDLNLKKSWHPTTLKNMERVWKAEQKHEAEKKKIEELQRELAEERAKEQIQHFAEESGVVKKKSSERLDWMYEGPSSMVNREDYLLGRNVDKTFELLQQNELGGTAKSDGDVVPESILKSATGNLTVDLANKIREDPLLMIRKQEEENKRKLLDNPVRMKQLQQLLHSMNSKKKKHKKEKKTKKNKHKSSKKKRRRQEKQDDLSPLESDQRNDVANPGLSLETDRNEPKAKSSRRGLYPDSNRKVSQSQSPKGRSHSHNKSNSRGSPSRSRGRRPDELEKRRQSLANSDSSATEDTRGGSGVSGRSNAQAENKKWSSKTERRNDERRKSPNKEMKRRMQWNGRQRADGLSGSLKNDTRSGQRNSKTRDEKQSACGREASPKTLSGRSPNRGRSEHEICRRIPSFNRRRTEPVGTRRNRDPSTESSDSTSPGRKGAELSHGKRVERIEKKRRRLHSSSFSPPPKRGQSHREEGRRSAASPARRQTETPIRNKWQHASSTATSQRGNSRDGAVWSHAKPGATKQQRAVSSESPSPIRGGSKRESRKMGGSSPNRRLVQKIDTRGKRAPSSSSSSSHSPSPKRVSGDGRKDSRAFLTKRNNPTGRERLRSPSDKKWARAETKKREIPSAHIRSDKEVHLLPKRVGQKETPVLGVEEKKSDRPSRRKPTRSSSSSPSALPPSSEQPPQNVVASSRKAPKRGTDSRDTHSAVSACKKSKSKRPRSSTSSSDSSTSGSSSAASIGFPKKTDDRKEGRVDSAGTSNGRGIRERARDSSSESPSPHRKRAADATVKIKRERSLSSSPDRSFTARRQRRELAKDGSPATVFSSAGLKVEATSKSSSTFRDCGSKKPLSSKERQQRLDEMLENAKWRDDQRSENLRRHKEEEKLEKRLQLKNADTDFITPFLNQVADVGTVSSRIKSNIYNIQRTKAALEKNFTKR